MYKQALYKLATKHDDDDDDEVSPLTGIGMLGAGLGAAYTGRKLLTDDDVGRLDNFAGSIATPNDKTPSEALQDYVIAGSAAAKVKPFGYSATEVLKGVRGAAADVVRGVNTVVNTGVDPEVIAWKGDDSAKHYQEFGKGAVPAYKKLLNEWSSSGRGWESPGAINSGHGVSDTVRELQYAVDHSTPYQVPTGVMPRTSITTSNLSTTRAAGDRIKAEAARLNVPITMPSADFEQRVTEQFNLLAKERFQSNDASALPPEQQAELIRSIDAHIQKTDPSLYLQKQVVDMTAGQSYKGPSMYKPLAQGLSASAKILRYGGLALATAGIGVGVYSLYKVLTKKKSKPREKTAALSANWKKTLAILAGAGVAAAAGYGVYAATRTPALADGKPAKPANATSTAALPTVIASQPTAQSPIVSDPTTQTVIASQPTAQPPTATSKPPVSTPTIDPRIAGFKSHWDSMPEWRRARAFKSLEESVGDPSKFTGISWWQRKKLGLLAGKDTDQYGANYGPVAKFVLDNDEPDLIRSAFDIARQNPGKDY